MRRFCLFLLVLLTCICTGAAAETYNDYPSLARAFNAATKDTTFVLGADLTFGNVQECTLINTSKAALTIDGNGHQMDVVTLLDGSLTLKNIRVTNGVIVSGMKKSNTTSVAIEEDAWVGGYINGIVIAQEAQGTIKIRNEGRCSTITSDGCAAKINIENTGLIEGTLGIKIADQRTSLKYGAVTIRNDGIIRGITSAGAVLALPGGTSVTLTGSGVMEGPCGMIVCCHKTQAKVTIQQDIRACNADFTANPAQYPDLWANLAKQAHQLDLPNVSTEEALTVEFQRKFRVSQLNSMLSSDFSTGEDVIGRALVLHQTSTIPYNGKITVSGSLYGNEGLIVLPDMNLMKGNIAIKSTISADSSKRVDVHYSTNVGTITPATWSKKLSTLTKKVFPAGVPEGIELRTRAIRHNEENGGLTYTTGWKGYAMDELHAARDGKKWQVTVHPLPNPGGFMTRYQVGETLSRAPDDTIMYLDANVSMGAAYDYYGTYNFAGSGVILDGQGYNLASASEEQRREMDPVEFCMNNGITLRNFNILNGIAIEAAKRTKGTAVIENVSHLQGLQLRSVNADLKNVLSTPEDDADIAFNHNGRYASKATITLDQNTKLYGFFSLSASSLEKKAALTLVNNGLMGRKTGPAWNGSITASNGATLKITGSGVMGNMENADPSREHFDLRVYSGGNIQIDHTVSCLHVEAGVDNDSSVSPDGKISIGGTCRFLTIECQDNANRCAITVTATGLEVFQASIENEGRNEPMTDKEAASFIKKNGPKLTYKKATDAQGKKIAPTWRILGQRGNILWEGQLP
ncbi:MAG: hypothetical protein IJF65_00155 [Clostridia bacterium]|nr:hypothetical protein [Clostridia bacterium]